MAQLRRALIIAPDEFPGEWDAYVAACHELNLEPNGDCYLVCRVSTATGWRTLLTLDLGLLQDTEKADTPDQAGLPSMGRFKESAPGTGTGFRGGRVRQSLNPAAPGEMPPPGRLRQPLVHPRESPFLPWQGPNPFGGFCRSEGSGSRTAGQPDRPVVELVLDRYGAMLKSAAVWNAGAGELGIAGGAVEAHVREAFADTAVEAVIGKLWPLHAASPALVDFDTAFMVLHGVLEPQTLLLKMINVAARVAATHAGMGVVAPLVGKFAEQLCEQYIRPPGETSLAGVLDAVDIDLYAAAGELPDCVALRDVTVELTSHGIEKLFKARFGVDTPGPEVGPGPPPQGPAGLSPI
jgi:hypothetical protein